MYTHTPSSVDIECHSSSLAKELIHTFRYLTGSSGRILKLGNLDKSVAPEQVRALFKGVEDTILRITFDQDHSKWASLRVHDRYSRTTTHTDPAQHALLVLVPQCNPIHHNPKLIPYTATPITSYTPPVRRTAPLPAQRRV